MVGEEVVATGHVMSFSFAPSGRRTGKKNRVTLSATRGGDELSCAMLVFPLRSHSTQKKERND